MHLTPIHLLSTLLLLTQSSCSQSTPSDQDLISAAASDYAAATSAIASIFSAATGPVESVFSDATAAVGSIFSSASTGANILVSGLGGEGGSVWSEITATTASTNTEIQTQEGILTAMGTPTFTSGIVTSTTVEGTGTATSSNAASSGESEGKIRKQRRADGVLFAAVFAAVAYL
ncbi:unnamed protein product [Aureobasidium uvarum]|uniref:GPI anchored protein n=1 Tax=Aureobasidium uvarum TaxID=2773716 RepID=A0A9N8KCS2_9PEZI|nr:unnamed protein product [Aureobasidium uvarum]